jgi:hypothetical protein
VARVGWVPTPRPPGGPAFGGCLERVGISSWPIAGTLTSPHVGSFQGDVTPTSPVLVVTSSVGVGKRTVIHDSTTSCEGAGNLPPRGLAGHCQVAPDAEGDWANLGPAPGRLQPLQPGRQINSSSGEPATAGRGFAQDHPGFLGDLREKSLSTLPLLPRLVVLKRPAPVSATAKTFGSAPRS